MPNCTMVIVVKQSEHNGRIDKNDSKYKKLSKCDIEVLLKKVPSRAQLLFGPINLLLYSAKLNILLGKLWHVGSG